MTEKDVLRAEIRKKAAVLPPEYFTEYGQRICENIFRSEYWRQAESVMAFFSMPGEPSLAPLYDRVFLEGKRLLFPRCREGGHMEARAVGSMNDLLPGRYHIPCPGEACPVCPPEEISLVLVPCLSCAPDGTRLGHGGGWYDRFLAHYRTAASGGHILCLCPERLLSPSLPREAHDMMMPVIVTESRVIRV